MNRKGCEAAILAWLGTRTAGASLGEVAEYLGLSKSYVGVLLRDLRDSGAVHRGTRKKNWELVREVGAG